MRTRLLLAAAVVFSLGRPAWTNKELRHDLDIAMAFITRHVRLAAEACDEVAAMFRGEIVERGRTAEVFGNPQGDCTKRLLSAVPGTLPIVDDGSAPPVSDPILYVPSAHPGCLAPHLRLEDGSSLYDHFGPGFTVLVTAGAASDAHAFAAAAAARGVPLTVAAPGNARLPGRYAARSALIRPDQHVAWRGDAVPDDVPGLLGRVTGHQSGG